VGQADQDGGDRISDCDCNGIVPREQQCFEVEGESPQELPVGSSFYETAERVILRFDNASSIAPMKFITHYLLHGKQELIEMLPENQS
jgi:hypothetical protein